MSNLVRVVSSQGKETSIANQNVITSMDSTHTAFVWKQFSIIAYSDCTIIINKNTPQESTLHLLAGLAFELTPTNTLSLKSLEFTTDGVQYYYIAGY